MKFLTPDWCKSLEETVNSHEGFKNAIANTKLGLQFAVSGVPEVDDYRYHIDIADGSATIAEGDMESPDATIKNDYETAKAISKGDLNTQMAFMTGKLKVEGDMGKLMMNQAALSQFAAAAAGVEVEY